MNNNQLNVLLLAPGGAGTHYNGAGTTFFRMYSHRANKRMNITLLHGSPDQKGGEDLYVEQHQVGSLDGSFLSKLKFIKQAKKWIKKNHQQFDVIHSITGFHLGLQPAHYAHSLGLPAVVTVAGHRSDLGTNASLFSRLMRFPQKKWKLAAAVDAMIATSSDIEQELLEVGVKEQSVYRIPYGVDSEKFLPVSQSEKLAMKQELKLAPDDLTVIFVGDSVPRKRPLLILQSLEKAVKAGAGIELAILGPTTNSDYVSEIKSFIRQHDLGERVHWFGMQENVSRFLSAADVFILPSKGEGLPNAMLEAMAAGLPSIGTEISGIKDLIDDEQTGFMVAPSVERISDRFQQLAGNRPLLTSMGTKARNKIEQKYALPTVIAQYENLFRKIQRNC